MSNPSAFRAWAVWDGHSERILAKTVSETATAARVNWLCVYANIFVPNDCSDAAIESAFDSFDGVAVVEVEISIADYGGLLQ